MRHMRLLGVHPCYLGPREHIPYPSSTRKNANILFMYTKDDHFSSLAGKTGEKNPNSLSKTIKTVPTGSKVNLSHQKMLKYTGINVS